MEEPWFEIVDGAAQDLDLILEIAATASTSTFNALRSTGEDRQRFLRSELPNLKRWVRGGQHRFLLARELATGKPIGYLLLNLWHQDDLGRRQTFVEDLAGFPEYLRRGLGRALTDAAAEVTASLGLDFMGAEMSATNPVFEGALRNRFLLEAHRIVRPCTPHAESVLASVKAAQEVQAFRARRKQRRTEP